MNSLKNIHIKILLLLNLMVLLGQLWPEGAPPFAKIINIVFLIFSAFYFIKEIIRTGNSASKQTK